MNSSNVTRQQAKKLVEAINPTKGYLNALAERMANRGFPKDDPLYLKVKAARDAVFTLWLDCHYRSCLGAVGETARKK